MRISKLYLVVCAVILSPLTPTVRADDSPNQAAARAALEQQMQAMDAQQATQNTPASASNAPVQSAQPAAANPSVAASTAAAAPATSAAVHSGNGLFGPVPPPSGAIPPSAITAQTTTPPAAGQIQPMDSSQKDKSNQGKALEMKPIVAPPLPISADQQAQLKALLERYDAGTITPVEYQAERKKILKLPE
jgi:hypothetical protein